uniref:SPRY-associated domain-containing protein n=1 Tax=Hucho hucho TaxID=62062 RepID=A0A4W5L9D7_9TELE
MPVSSPPTDAIWGTEVPGWALKHLDLSFNRLNDSGVVLLSARLEDPHGKLEKLRMSWCFLTETCCYTLGSVLGSNSSPLRELDVSNNDLQDSGMKMLSAGLGNPHCKLEILSLNQNEELWFKPELLKKYATEITLDPNTANKYILLIEENRKLTCVDEEQTYPDDPQRFEEMPQTQTPESRNVSGLARWHSVLLQCLL